MLGIDVPPRPQGLRLQTRNPDANGGGEWGTAGAGPAENVGLVSTLLGFGIQFGASGRSSLLINSMSPEQQQQAFLSQLLLLLGSFVILCLLIF
jgi:E3 ubiquitin-protein ligase RNF5